MAGRPQLQKGAGISEDGRSGPLSPVGRGGSGSRQGHVKGSSRRGPRPAHVRYVFYCRPATTIGTCRVFSLSVLPGSHPMGQVLSSPWLTNGQRSPACHGQGQASRGQKPAPPPCYLLFAPRQGEQRDSREALGQRGDGTALQIPWQTSLTGSLCKPRGASGHVTPRVCARVRSASEGG